MDCVPDAGTITATRCGGGLIDPGEECDDGNRQDGDGCSALCLNEGPAAAAEI